MTQATELRELASLLRVHDGKIGIGPLTANPPYTLSLGQTNVAGAHTIRLAGNGNPKHEIQFREAGTSYGFTFRYAGDAADNKLHIVQHENDANGTEVMTFKRDSMEVGIGADSPDLLYEGLHIKSANPSLKIEGTGTNSWEFIHLKQPNHERLIGMRTTGSIVINSGTNLDANNMLVIDTAGKVGVNVEYPDHDLDVNGAIATRQVRHSISPTLNLDFANSKQLDSRITFYRDSIATYYDSKGIIRYANVNEPRFDHDPITGESKGLLIEEARENIALATTLELPYDFNLMYVSKYYEIAPDGTYSGHRVIASSGVSRHEVNIKYPGTSGVVYTGSTWVKPLGAVTHFNVSRAGGSDMVRFVLTGDGSIDGLGGSATGTITKGNNGWYKISITYTEATTGSARAIYMSPGAQAGSSSVYSNLNGDGINGVALWGSQVEQGAFVTSYVPLDTRFTSRSSEATYYDETGILRTAPANSPRYGYSSPYATEHWALVSTLKTKIGSTEPERSLKETGLILENAATNLEDYSYNMDTTNHGQFISAGGSFAVTREVAAPDGSYTASKFVFGAGNDRMDDQHGAHNQGTYTFSMWIKGVAGEVVGMSLLNDLGGNVEPYILLTGEWQRISITKTFDSQGSNIRTHGVIIRGAPGVGVYATADDGGNGTLGTWANYVYVWGMQVEAGFTTTSYISTKAGTATRSADVVNSTAYSRPHDIAYIDKITNEDWYNTREGSVYTDFYPLSVDGTDEIVVYVEDGTSSRGFRAPWVTSGGQVRIGTWSGSAYTALEYYNGITIESPHKSALSFSYENEQFISSLDGSTAATVNSWGGVEADATTIWIGGESETHRPYNGHIAKVSIYNEALSGAELQALTENN